MGPTIGHSTPVPFQTALEPRLEKAINNAKTAAERGKGAVKEDALTETYRRVNGDNAIDVLNNRLKLSIDEGTGTVVGQIVNRQSGEMVKQIPSEEALVLIAHAKEIFGSIINETV